jgi:hypothetical protein
MVFLKVGPLRGVMKLPKVQCRNAQISVQKIAFIEHPNCQISAETVEKGSVSKNIF